MHSNLLKAAFPRSSSKGKRRGNDGTAKPSGMMAQGDARFHGIDEDTMIREGREGNGGSGARRQEENFGRVEL